MRRIYGYNTSLFYIPYVTGGDYGTDGPGLGESTPGVNTSPGLFRNGWASYNIP